MAKYYFKSSNAMLDGKIINDFVNDEEAKSFASNYEADVYRIEPKTDSEGYHDLTYLEWRSES